ncbi:MAG: hypothetical protein IPQ05_05575 [Leptospiraceae bacterium]|nr:hypothetical protein [Leptospiraceae bacterium]
MKVKSPFKTRSRKIKFNESIVVEPNVYSQIETLKYYERIEKIILINGRTEVGAIINQEDSIMVVHTENGIVRINTNEIVEVVYDLPNQIQILNGGLYIVLMQYANRFN